MNLQILCLVARLALADVHFTQPAASAVYLGGSTIQMIWHDSGSLPSLSTLTNYVINLCAGGNDLGTFQCSLAALVTDGSFSNGNKASSTIPSNIGADAKLGYFIQIISTSDTGAQVVNYSPRFTLTGMTGTFTSTILSSLSALGTITIAGPARTVEDSGGPWAVPYNLQTGLTRYAPMQPVPGSKITASTASPLWPTSSAILATTWLAMPRIATTITQSQTWSTSSKENTEAPVSNPIDEAMAKWLKRWRD